MDKRAQLLKTAAYLRGRNGGLFELSEDQIAKELLVSKADVSVLLASEELKSCHVDDVAAYIIEKDD